MSVNTRVFDPAFFLSGGDTPADVTLPDLLILNQPIADSVVFSRLWKHTKYRVCVDGGANRLHDMFVGELEAQRVDYLPNAIHGDLDSLRDDVRAYYVDHGVKVTQDPDQESNDFGKAMDKISEQHISSSPREILVLGTFAGRVDQGLGLLHEMFREEMKDSGLRFWLFSECNVSFILKDTHSVIRGLLSSRSFTENVGIIPVYGPATITTSGLEWDVQDWGTQMGHRVSTSNHVKADEVRICTNAPILFTIERSPLSMNVARDLQ